LFQKRIKFSSMFESREQVIECLKSLMYVLALFLCFAYTAQAKHIIGGYVRYDHLGSGNYLIKIYIYRDCRPQEDAAGLDNEIAVSIFEKINSNNFAILENRNIPLRSRQFVDAPDFDCLTLPPNLCVELGYYELNYRVRGWPLDRSIVVAHQRCCRNNTITNLVSPDDTGATFSIEITPEAMRLGSSSPDFNAFPPTVICAGFPLSFDHSARGQTGDSLVYKYCSPLAGGGLRGSFLLPGNATACDGVVPSPACPPFRTVTFKTPAYSVNRPLAGNPVVNIDSRTGMIEGVPETLGQFVAGVCVEQWRGGQLLSISRREFQFNVTDCSRSVIADVDATNRLDEKVFYYRSCGSLQVDIANRSSDRRFIREVLWRLDLGGQESDTLFSDHFSYLFPDYGRYQAKLLVNEGLPCSDSLEIIIDVFEEIKSDFSFDYDTCALGGVQFTNASYSLGGEIVEFEWDFGDGAKEQGIWDPEHFYGRSGEFEVGLRVLDENGCEDLKKILLPFFPIPLELFVAPLDTSACQPLVFDFNQLSSYITDDYIILWDFGDGVVSEEARPIHIYEEPGKFSISFEVENRFGCKASALFENNIEVLIRPIAQFSIQPTEITSFTEFITFNNSSLHSDRQEWYAGGILFSQLRNPLLFSPDTGIYEMVLIAENLNGCRDTASLTVDVVPKVTYHMPNAFTPNGDGNNDFFLGKGVLEGLRSFELLVFNRYGQLLFSSEDPFKGWNGRLNNTGEMQRPGVYVYKVSIVGPRGEAIEEKGNFSMIR
jgi:gliding motility-associated-like protein